MITVGQFCTPVSTCIILFLLWMNEREWVHKMAPKFPLLKSLQLRGMLNGQPYSTDGLDRSIQMDFGFISSLTHSFCDTCIPPLPPFCLHQCFLMSKDSTGKDQIKGILNADHEEKFLVNIQNFFFFSL